MRASLPRPLCLGLVVLSLACSLFAGSSGPTYAQSSPQPVSLAVGADSHTHLLWNNPNGSAALWDLDASGSVVAQPAYGPYADGGGTWKAVAVSVGPDSLPHILWDNPDGRAVLWNGNPNGTYSDHGQYGPYTDSTGTWKAVAVATDLGGVSHILWTCPDGRMVVWYVNPDGTHGDGGQYGPYTDSGGTWKAVAVSVGPDSLPHILWDNPDGRAVLWNGNPNGTYSDHGQYGPYTDSTGTWKAVATSVGPDNLPRLLWTSAGGNVSLWTVGADGSIAYHQYGPFAGLSAVAVSVGPDSRGRILWDGLNGSAQVWAVNPNGTYTIKAYHYNAGSGTPAADVPALGWAEDVIPSDSSDAAGSGPSASESVSLPSGVKENHPGSDLDVFNPRGPSVSYTRMYRSALAAKGIYTPGLSPGWQDNYSLSVTAMGGGSYTLNYPNGASENWTTTGGVISPASGTPYLVSASSGSLTMTFKDHSYYTFTPDPNNASNYLLIGLSNLAGGTVTIIRDAANGNRITSLSNAAGPLLTLNYNGAFLSTITDVYSRTVTYGFTSSNLSTISQVNAAGTIRWQYGYQTINGLPYLNAVMVPDPSGGGMSEADTQYTPDGHVAQFQDGEGNQRVYTYGPQAATVSVYGADGTLVQTWTQKFDPANHNVDKGVIDANNNATTLVYGDAVNPYKVTAATNKNGQTAYAAFDGYGNTVQATDLRGVQTQNGYDPAFPLGQVTQIQVGTNQPSPKSPTNFTYYDGTTQVGGVTQPKGLVQTMSVPTPGSSGTGAQVTTTYVYTAMGNALTVTSPGPNIGGASVTTTYNYTSDPSYDAYGNTGSFTTAERLGQPLTLTDPLGNVTHFRYDSHGNTITMITPPVISYPDTSTARGLRTDYTYNALDQLTGIVYPATNPGTPAARASAGYSYEYVGGPLLGVTQYDENNNTVRQAVKGDGKEGESKSQAGSVQQANLKYDPRFRLNQKVDGNNNVAQSYGYDAVGNLTAQTFALGDGTHFTQYDADNNLMQMQDGRGITTTYTRAADDSRVTGVSHSDSTPSVSIGANGYDVYNRVSSWSDGAGSYTTTYDDDDNLLTKTTTYTGLPSVTVSYSYNNDGSRASMTTPRSLSGGAYTYWTFSYTYDGDGQPISLTCPWARSATNSSPAVFNYYYDEVGRLLKQHTTKADTYYIYNARGWIVQQQSANTFSTTSFGDPSTEENGHTGHPVGGNIPSRTAQGIMVTGDTFPGFSYSLLADYSNMQYDSLGNRLRMDVTIPDFYIYDTLGNYTSYPPLNKDIDGSLFYAWDNKDRMTLETTYFNGSPTIEDYPLGNGLSLYNANWNYPTGADPADNLTMLRGNTQSFNANDQLATETYDGEGNRTSYNGGTILYDALDRATSVPGGGGANAFTQLFTGEGERAWKQPAGLSKTYYLSDGDALLMELSSTGAPVNTYAYGAGGLLERFQHTNSGVPYVVYLFDPNGSLVHRVRSIDPALSSGAAVMVQDTAVYDSQGLLHADIDTLTGGFNSGHLDPIGYKGEVGNYTDVETQRAVSGLYTALSGPGGASYYDPLTGVGMARSRADGVNAYADALNPLAGWSWGSYFHEAGQFGIGEGKGFVNFASGSVVYSSPELQMIDAQTGGHLSSPLAASGESQSDGAGAADKIALVGSFFTGEGEAVAVEGGAAKILAGAGRGVGPGGARMQRGFVMLGFGKAAEDPYKFESFDLARNAALKWLEERGFKSERPVIARLGNNTGKVIGRSNADGTVGFRFEFDGEDKSGAHINVFDHNAPKMGKMRNLPHFKFPGDQKTINSLIKRFSR